MKTYLVLRVKDKKIIKQFNDYQLAWNCCREQKQKNMVALITLNTKTYKVEETTLF